MSTKRGSSISPTHRKAPVARKSLLVDRGAWLASMSMSTQRQWRHRLWWLPGRAGERDPVAMERYSRKQLHNPFFKFRSLYYLNYLILFVTANNFIIIILLCCPPITMQNMYYYWVFFCFISVNNRYIEEQRRYDIVINNRRTEIQNIAHVHCKQV